MGNRRAVLDVGGSRGIGGGVPAHTSVDRGHTCCRHAGGECHRAMKNCIARAFTAPRFPIGTKAPTTTAGSSRAWDRATLRRRHNLPLDVQGTRRDARQIRRSSHGDKEPLHSHTNCAPRTTVRSSSSAVLVHGVRANPTIGLCQRFSMIPVAGRTRQLGIYRPRRRLVDLVS